ncbi:MAG: 30S ribosomal protein S16 [Patescibacteria group bacterium]|nr:30S ribosomal protein S16 [Patescibacteria group bacterium]
MLVIRFSRVGRHNHAQYRIIVQEKTQSPTKKHLDIVGSYDPHSKKTVLQEEKIKEYLANGAQPSDSVYNLLVRNEVITGAKRTVKLPEKKVSADTEESTEEKPEEKEGVAVEEEAVTTDEAVSADEKPKADKKEAKEEVREEKTEEKKEEKKSNDDKGSDETREDKAEKTTEKK